MKSLHYILSILLLAIILPGAVSMKIMKAEYIGQRCPPDMEFIPGNDSISSFFMGKSQETNMDWEIYLNWLGNVYQDFPEVSIDALPHELDLGELARNNDPLITSQLNNPAFAYYPVTGCDWVQIQNYLSWKTDRVNELIMIKSGEIQKNPNQSGEDNFNTEAISLGQYKGADQKQSFDGAYMKTKCMALYNPYFLTGFRLPTEEEWEYASGQGFRNTISAKGLHPYGRKFYLAEFMRDYRNPRTIKEYLRNAGRLEPADSARIKGANTFDLNQYGIYNMGNNVKEWMMDIYSENPRHYTSIEAIYWQNGLHLSKPSEYCNRDGYIVDKDSLGHLPFRTMGYHANGNDIWVSRFPYEPKNYSGAYRVVKSGNWKHPSLKAREKVYDKGASAEIGFRTVMQYNGIPIDTKYMVNWK